MDLSANTFYRRVREYEIQNGIAEQTSAWQRSQTNEKATQCSPSLRRGKLTAEKEKPSETLTERFRELVVIRFNRVCVWCGMLHNVWLDFYGMVGECDNRLYSKISIFSMILLDI